MKQECIPVGRVPSASMAVSGGRESAQGRGCLPRVGGVCLVRCLSHLPRGQTDACENIILPQTSFVGGNEMDFVTDKLLRLYV